MLLTGSALERLDKCVAAGVLPQARDARGTPAAHNGVVVHKYLADVPELGRDEALTRVPDEHREACEVIELSALPACQPDAYAPEVAFRYELATDTAVELWRGENRRAYEPMEGVVYCTLDVVGLCEDAVVVIDYKTGRADLAPAGALWQLRFGALAAARAYGKDSARVAICRIREDGSAWFEWAEFSAMDLDAIATELQELVARVEAERAKVNPLLATATLGYHCKYCPSRSYCPAQSGLATDVATGELTVDLRQFPREKAAAVLERVALYEQLFDEVKRQVKEMAEEAPIDLGNGWVLGVKEDPDTLILPDTAVPILEELYGSDVAHSAVEVKATITQAQLKRALRLFIQRTPGAKITKVFGSCMDTLKERGGAKVVVAKRVMRHKPRALAAQSTQTEAAPNDGASSGADEEEPEKRSTG